MQISPTVRVTQGFLELHQVTPDDIGSGGDLCLFEIWSVPPPEQYEADWAFSKKVSFNTTASGADIVESLTGFPLLIRLDNANFAEGFDYAQASGADIRVVDRDGACLPYAFEQWAPASGKALLWVRVPQIDGASDQDYVTLYWGNENALDRQNPQAIFNGEYGGVWHFGHNEDLADASTNNNDALDEGTAAIDGHIGVARQYNAAQGDRLRVPDASSLDLTDALSISAWIKLDQLPAAGAMGIVAKASSSSLAYSFCIGDAASN
jgi:biopolymer transport protein ExbB